MFAFADIDLGVATRGVSLASSRDGLEDENSAANIRSCAMIDLHDNRNNSSSSGKQMRENLYFASNVSFITIFLILMEQSYLARSNCIAKNCIFFNRLQKKKAALWLNLRKKLKMICVILYVNTKPKTIPSKQGKSTVSSLRIM